MAKMEGKSLTKPDEVRTFKKGKSEIIHIGGRTVRRLPSSLDGDGLIL
jgi:hypothetical protein